MARANLRAILEASQLPVTMGPWAKDEIVPDLYVEYHREGSSDKAADNYAYRRIDRWVISVYGQTTDMTDFYDACERIEQSLDESKIFAYRSMDIFPGDDRVYTEFTFSLKR